MPSIWYFGTPGFAVPPLQALLEHGEKVSLVVTQPDRPAGRREELKAPEVKQFALAHALPVFQPERVRAPEAISRFQAEAEKDWPELAVVTAFGQIIPKTLLAIPRRGFWNIHASLLPRLRGASPIQGAILEGMGETGVTIMQMDEGLDTGDILLTRACPIGPDETAGELHDRLAPLGAEALIAALDLARQGRLTPRKQDDSLSTHAPKLDRASGQIDWSHPARRIVDQIRALNPWPSAQTTLEQERIKIHRAQAVPGSGAAGTIISYEPLVVASGEGAVEILELQREGKKPLGAHDFVRGLRLKPGARFGR